MEFETPRIYFTLNTKTISASNTIGDYPLSNNMGSINQYRTNIVWKGVSIKNILGELYDHYNLFNIQLVLSGYDIGTTLYGVTADDRAINIGMTGLEWDYCNYNVSTGNTTNESIIGMTIYNGQATADVGDLQKLFCNSFRKSYTADIGIILHTVLGPEPNMNVGTIYPQLSFTFVITPIK